MEKWKVFFSASNITTNKYGLCPPIFRSNGTSASIFPIILSAPPIPAANSHRSYTYSMNLLPYRLKNGRLYSYRYVLLFDLYLLADTTEDRYDLILMELCSFLESCSLIGTLFNGWDLWYSRRPQENHTKFHEKINHIIIRSRVRLPFAPYQHLSDLHRALVIDGNFDPEIEEITEYLHFWCSILDRKRGS